MSYIYGEQLPPNLPDDYPIYEVLEMATDWPVSLSVTDEVSVVVMPEGEQAKLVAMSDIEGGTAKPVAEQIIELDTPLIEARRIAGDLARKTTRMLSEIWEAPDFEK